MDDYEMMNVRGGSPPPISHTSMPPAISMSQYPPYDSEDDSESSYDSADSAAGGDRNRRRRKRSRERKRKRNRERNRDEDEKKEKRNRRNSEDEKHRSEPQKLELCKFYLMECCAKREKCSYMHKEFPCKYYYLGMDCVSEEPCKFLHGEPLTVELRNILLKHLETAPKEILGNFKRISKENAMTMIIKRHEELCQKYNVQNVWPPNSIHPMNMGNRRSDRGHNNNTNTNQQSLLMQQKSQSQNNKISNIPSLLDIVVNPPVSLQNKSSADKPRKSRWADSGNINTSSSTSSSTVSSNKQYTETDLPACFDLKNLSNIISAEHMTKMNAMGITNLKQVEQLTFGQLNEIGLTIAEVSEIQLNAMNMAKLGIGTGGTATTAKTSNSSAATPLLPTPKMNKSETEMTM